MSESEFSELENVFDHSEKDFWAQLPAHVKQGLERSQKQAEAGLLTPHDEVMKKHAKYVALN